MVNLTDPNEVCGDAVNVCADHIALARWLQEEIQSMLFPEFADQELPVVEAVFSKNGDGRSFWTEVVESEEGTGYGFAAPFVLRTEAGSTPGSAHGVDSCFVSARRAQLTLDGVVARGTAFHERRDDLGEQHRLPGLVRDPGAAETVAPTASPCPWRCSSCGK